MAKPILGGFGTGIVTTDIGGSFGGGAGVVIDDQGRIWVAGDFESATGNRFALVRYNPDGTLDTSFSGDGILTTAIGDAFSLGTDIAIQSDGKVVVSGFRGDENTFIDFAVARYNENGTLDTSFGSGGKVATDVSGYDDRGARIAIQPDGKILVVGFSDGSTYDPVEDTLDDNLTIVRYNANGTLDTSFSYDGIAVTRLGDQDDAGKGIAIQTDGKIVVVGYSDNGSTRDIIVARYNENGSLDASFGPGGVVTSGVGLAEDEGVDVQIQADGKIVVAGFSAADTSIDFTLIRYNQDGSLDTGFGVGGFATASPGFILNQATSIALQDDGKILVAGTSYTGLFGLDVSLVRFNADGTIDTSFGVNGVAIVAIGVDTDVAFDVKVQADGKIVLVGRTDTEDGTHFVLIRFNEDGSQDTSLDPVYADFDENGPASVLNPSITLSDDDSADLTGATIAITDGFLDGDLLIFTDQNGITGNYDPDTGTLTLSGLASIADYQTALRSIAFSSPSEDPDNNDANPVRTISWTVTDGVETSATAVSKVTIHAENDLPEIAGAGGTVAYTEGGPEVIIDSDLTISDADHAIIRRATVTIREDYQEGDQLNFVDHNGIRGTFYSSTGRLVLSGDASIEDYQAALRSVTFSSTSDNPDDFGNNATRTVRWQVDDEDSDASEIVTSEITINAVNDGEEVSKTQSGKGYIITDVAGLYDYAYELAVQPDGKIIAGGMSRNETGYNFAVLRYNKDGSLDSSFHNDGIATTNLPGQGEIGYSLTVQTDGKILLGGETGNDNFGLVRYKANGALDKGFGQDGVVTTNIKGSNEAIYSVAVQENGKILVAGVSKDESGSSRFTVVRYKKDGELDASFGSGGIATTDIGPASYYGRGLVLQNDGKIVVAGYAYVTGSNLDLALARYNADGSLDNDFGNAGIVITSLSDFDYADSAYAVALQDDGRIVVAGESYQGAGNHDFAVVRYNEDGTLDTSFGADGVVTTDIGNDDHSYSVTIQADGKILVAGYSAPTTTAYDVFALIRYNTDGSLDMSFGEAGIVTTDLPTLSEKAWSVLVQNDGKIIVTGHGLYRNPDDNYDIIVARYNEDGSLDKTFDGGKGSFAENGPPVALSSTLIVDAVDSTELVGATVSISEGFKLVDQLHYTDRNGIAGSYDENAGVLTLSGAASHSDYQAALRSILFSSPGNDPDNGGASPTRTISWQVNDGDALSDIVNSIVAITAIDELPTSTQINPVLTEISEDASTAARIKFGDIVVTDPDNGINALGLSGADADMFEIDGTELFLKAGAGLDYETNRALNVAVTVDQDGAGGEPDFVGESFSFKVLNVSPEIIDGTAGPDALTGGADKDIIKGLSGNDILIGGGGADVIDGGVDDDSLIGGKGKDVLRGGAGEDILRGGKDKDKLFGGAHADIFDFNNTKESGVKGSERDTIYDFERGLDLIDLKDIDAKKGGGNQKFKWIGKSKFSEKAGELRIDDKGSKVYVQGDVDGDGKEDFAIMVKVNKLTDNDFVL